MAAGHGGSRPGAGRPKGSTTGKTPDADAPRFNDALEYLEAVVRGDVRPDPLRIAAAKVVLPFQAPKKRAPVASLPPSKLRVKAERAADEANKAEWDKRATAIRQQHKGTTSE